MIQKDKDHLIQQYDIEIKQMKAKIQYLHTRIYKTFEQKFDLQYP